MTTGNKIKVVSSEFIDKAEHIPEGMKDFIKKNPYALDENGEPVTEREEIASRREAFMRDDVEVVTSEPTE